jgi:CheY-like chemotaxis protein
MLKEVLVLAGHDVTVATRGREGIDLAKAHKPDVVLCDLGLPDGVSGYDVARELRLDPSLGGVRMVALSGYGRPEDKAQGKEAGFDVHLTKPVDAEALERVLLGEPADGPDATAVHAARDKPPQ